MLERLLLEYSRSGALPMHMPGHKRRAEFAGALPFSLDVTEIPGFDDLYHAEGVLKETMDAAARLYGSGKAFLGVNGSTGCILAAVYAAARPGDTVLVARNSHRSVYHALEIARCHPVFLQPEADGETGILGSVSPEAVEKALQARPEARLVIVTSPTYEGVVSDIWGICQAAHRYGAAVLVDAAHGAHLGFSPGFPESPVSSGADLVVMSLHKTLPSLTQTALLHLRGDRVDEQRLGEAMSVFNTSSPSYVLMASIDRCLRLLEKDGPALFERYEAALRRFSEGVRALQTLSVLGHGRDGLSHHPAFFAFDPGKVVVDTRRAGLTGPAFAERLRQEHNIVTEMSAPGYVLAMTSLCDDDESLGRFLEALLDLDKKAPFGNPDGLRAPLILETPRADIPLFEAARMEGERVPLEKAAGRTALEYVWAYPPGVPVLVPGEVVEEPALNALREMTSCGLSVRSSRGSWPGGLYCAGKSARGRD